MMRLITGILLILLANPLLAWELAKDDDGIKVYTKAIEGSDFKAFKGTMNVEASLKQLVAFHMHPESMPDWIQDCKESKLVQKLSDREFVVYYVTKAPWPVSDRDYVLHSRIDQNPESKVVTINFETMVGVEEQADGCVRVTEIVGSWTFTPQADNTIFVEYESHANPNGDIPSWLANSFVVDQPYKTLQKWRKKIAAREYESEEIAFIVEP